MVRWWVATVAIRAAATAAVVTAAVATVVVDVVMAALVVAERVPVAKAAAVPAAVMMAVGQATEAAATAEVMTAAAMVVEEKAPVAMVGAAAAATAVARGATAREVGAEARVAEVGVEAVSMMHLPDLRSKKDRQTCSIRYTRQRPSRARLLELWPTSGRPLSRAAAYLLLNKPSQHMTCLGAPVLWKISCLDALFLPAPIQYSARGLLHCTACRSGTLGAGSRTARGQGPEAQALAL